MIAAQDNLTRKALTTILYPLSKKTEVWRGNQSNGHKRPLSNVVFLCPPKTRAVLRLVLFIMAGLFGQRSALAGTVTGFPPHLSPPPDTVESISGGYPLYNGVTA